MLRNRNDVTAMRAVLMMLRDFLAAVAQGDKKVFEKFFADDVVYTSSAGVTMDKAAVMKTIGAHAETGSKATYRAEDITVHPYEGVVVVNFRMVMDDEEDGRRETACFRNTGTFLKRSGQWQVVAWHATKASPEDAAKKQ
jgi:ketosteroid isomerase-like protein